MKAMLPWVCCMALAPNVFAVTGLEAYYQADYTQAATLFQAKASLAPIEDYYLGRMYLYGYGVLKSNALAVQSFRRAAEKGLLPAQLLLAKIELNQNNNPEQALFWFKKAAKLNDLSAQMYCAGAYLFGVGTVKNLDAAREFYIAAARGENSIAQQTLAANFLDTKQPINQKMGLVWLNKAVLQRDPEAELMLAELTLKGELVTQNMDEAKRLIEDAITQGYVPAFYQMGRFEQRQSHLQDAQIWYRKAADLNYAPAQIALAELYFDPKNTIYSVQNGFFWLQKAAETGSYAAQRSLAAMYQSGQMIKANPTLAAEWEQKSQTQQETEQNAEQKMAEWLTYGKAKRLADTDYRLMGIYNDWHDKTALQDNIYNQSPLMNSIARQHIYQAQFSMIHPNDIPIHQFYDAMMLAQPKHRPQELIFPQYAIHMQTASKDGTAVAEKNLLQAQRDGYDYLTQETLSAQHIDYSQVFKKLLNQAALGDSLAQFDVAQLYQQGIGVTQSTENALKFYVLAAAQNDLPAEYHLGLIYLQGLGVEPDYKIGMEWLTDAAFKGNCYAQYALAQIYEYGYQDKNGKTVIPEDPEQSLAMYQLAAANHYGLAEYALAEIMVRSASRDMSVTGLELRNKQIKRLYQGAVNYGVAQAKLPLAYYYASDADETKQAQAFADIQQAAVTGSVDAAFLLGIMYDRGIATGVSREQALHWYEQAAANPISAFVLGTYAAEGVGIAKNLEKATDYLQFAAEKNFAPAYYNLAVLKQGQHSPFLPYLDKAVALGLSRAGLGLADYYMSQTSSVEQLRQARILYEQFAKQGDQSAQLKLGYLFEQGIGVNPDYNQALSWYTMAANQGQKDAQYLLGRLYQLGLVGKEPDYTLAKQWYAAAQDNYAPAAVAYGFLEETQNDDYPRAFNAYQHAADLEDPIANYDLGLIYEKGKGQPTDVEKAQELYLIAANQGVVKAMVSLGNLYAQQHKMKKSLSWLNKAAMQNDPDAMYQLGWLSEQGLNPQGTIKDAVTYYQSAAALGQSNAMLALARIYQLGTGVSPDLQKSASYYAELARRNYPTAQYQLAKFCLAGVAKECTNQEAKNWLIKAGQNGCRDAAQLLRLQAAQLQTDTSYIESIGVSQG